MSLILVCMKMVFILVGLAFLTLLERKILGLIQSRKGPNKVSMMGILQPMADAIKLFSKEVHSIMEKQWILFLMSPLISLTLMMLLSSILSQSSSSGVEYNMFLFLAIMSLGVYPLLMMGLSTMSKYPLLGSIRGVAQTVSYEINLSMLLISLLFLVGLLDVSDNHRESFMLLIPAMILLVISLVAETNRTPFDFSEGESELVSGFNTEYGGTMFALIFIAEYGMIFILSVMMSMLMNMNVYFGGFLMSLWIVLRGTFPRFRYDLLLNFSWKMALPLSMAILFFSGSILS